MRERQCDEQRPRCSQCRRRDMICAYQGDSQPPLPIWPGRKTPPVLANDSSAFTTEHDLEMLHHFIDVVGPNMYSKEVLQAKAIDIWSLATKRSSRDACRPRLSRPASQRHLAFSFARTHRGRVTGSKLAPVSALPLPICRLPPTSTRYSRPACF